ncbi:hypothetical protein F2Q70_00012643 [Brassica cretica]|uniref:Uncharacterized protein n=1 Tax=Brassica cretica TaxID=69181 RepID=A0A8S9M4K8_BRACR|nr:hypothetical protein F2Q70_00012643 [Brassica cretica]
MKKQFEISIVSAVRTYQMIENKYDLFLGPSRMQKLSKEWFMSAMPDESVGRVKERVRPLQLVEESPIVRDLQVGSTTQGFNGKRCDVWWTAYYKESFVVHEKCKWVANSSRRLWNKMIAVSAENVVNQGFMSAMPDESVGRVKERVQPLQLVEDKESSKIINLVGLVANSSRRLWNKRIAVSAENVVNQG